MKRALLSAVALACIAVPAAAQQNLNSTSGSNANANSGSVSGAASDVSNAANNNIGTSESNSNSNAGAVSGSNSASESNGNMQGQSANNSQGQMQGQDAHNTQGQNQSQGQMSSQANGQNVNMTFNSKSPDHVQVRTNTPVGLAASSSFSSDYCGGTQSAGASAAPIGISIGASGPKYDRSCQALRRAEKFGMAAANMQNMGQPDMAQKLMTMMVWSICMSDTTGPASGVRYPDGRVALDPTVAACMSAGLVGAPMSAANEPTPGEAQPGRAPVARTAEVIRKVTPDVATRTVQVATQLSSQDTRLAGAVAH